MRKLRPVESPEEPAQKFPDPEAFTKVLAPELPKVLAPELLS